MLDAELYASLLLVVLVTTLAAPPLLRLRLKAMRGAARDLQVDAMPGSGWLWVDDDVVDLAAHPPMEQQTTIALDAALLISEGARPGPKLLDWLGHGDPAVWEPESTERLVEVLVRGNERGWRFLDTSGVLVRALPEVAEAVARRHRDPGVIDPNQVVRFETIEALQFMLRVDAEAVFVHARLAHRDRVVLGGARDRHRGRASPTDDGAGAGRAAGVGRAGARGDPGPRHRTRPAPGREQPDRRRERGVGARPGVTPRGAEPRAARST